MLRLILPAKVDSEEKKPAPESPSAPTSSPERPDETFPRFRFDLSKIQPDRIAQWIAEDEARKALSERIAERKPK